MDTDSFIVHVKTDDVYRDTAEDVGLKEKNKKVLGLMKNELGRQIMKEFVGLRANTDTYLKDNNDEDKNAKGTKKCVIKRKLKLQDYFQEYVKNKLILKTQQRFKSERHNVYTEEINKIVLSSNDNKRM